MVNNTFYWDKFKFFIVWKLKFHKCSNTSRLPDQLYTSEKLIGVLPINPPPSEAAASHRPPCYTLGLCHRCRLSSTDSDSSHTLGLGLTVRKKMEWLGGAVTERVAHPVTV
jgi:hypothetical protein